MPHEKAGSGCEAPDEPALDGVAVAADIPENKTSPTTSQALPCRRFDYSGLPADTAAEARKVAARYHARTKEYLFETGQDLLHIKDQLEHGQFLAWVEQELGLKPRMAQNFMAAARTLTGKSATVAYLGTRAVFELAAASTPDPARQEILRRIEREERPAPDEVIDFVRNARAADRKAKAEVKLTPEEKTNRVKKERRKQRSAEQRQAEIEQYRREYDERDRQQCARAVEALKILNERFEDDELRQLVELLDNGVSSVVCAVLRGKLPFYTPRSGADMLSHWVEFGRKLFSTDLGGTS